MAQIPTRTLGPLTTSAIGFGAMVLSPGVYGEVDDDRGVRALHAALDAGATFVDTADGAENTDAARVALHPDTLTRVDEALSRFTPTGEGALL